MPYDNELVFHLQNRSKKIRRYILEMIYEIQSGHSGGSLSIVEILLVLYLKKMNIDPQNPLWEDRDRFILSKLRTSTVCCFGRCWIFSERTVKRIIQAYKQ